MTRILLVRHGHVEGIAPERFRGRHDVPLSALGQQQAQAAGQHIAASWRLSILYASPLQRCMQTGQAISAACGAPMQALEALVDLDYGAWQWQTHEAVAAQWPTQLALWREAPHRMRFPQGESLQDLNARVADGVRQILERHPNETIVLVGHDSTNRVLLLQWLEMPLSGYWRLAQDPCGLSEIEVSDRDARVVRINETQHLHAGPP